MVLHACHSHCYWQWSVTQHFLAQFFIEWLHTIYQTAILFQNWTLFPGRNNGRNFSGIRALIYIVLAGLDKVCDVGRATTCRRKFKAPSLQTKITKNGGPPENRGYNGKPVWKFQTERRTETVFSTFQKKPNRKERTLQVSIDHGPRKQ